MKRLGILTVALFLSFLNPLISQDTLSNQKVSGGLDVYSQHLWRGFANGTSISIQPSVEFTHKGFTGGAWGAWSIDGSYTELDLYIAYKKGDFTATIFDYFCPVNPVESFEFFEINKGKTKHTFDLNLEYANPEKHPFSLLVATMLYGDDLNPETGNSYFSTYIEPAAGFHIGKTGYKIFAGFTPFESYYAEKAAFVNTGVSASHTFMIADRFKLPVKAAFVYNPYQHKPFLTFGINL
ncbi:MAG: hypothetical protein AB9834_24285 [Lentimicrobium sp.]